ncbi:carbon-nitrogen hydrolase family protein [bacterium]|nr:carbon-nitrogen hydrolase family protein [bacterium]
MKRRTFVKAAAAGGFTGILEQGCSAMVNRSKPPNPEYLNKSSTGQTAALLSVATCQFTVTGNIENNCRTVLRLMDTAKAEGADVAHFSETCLGGYAGVDFETFDTYDWDTLRRCTETIMNHAGELHLWVILGSNHRLTENHKPHNSLYVIDDNGKIVDRYDKMFCTGNKEGTSGDLKHYSSGSHFSVLTIKGIICGLQICHDMRYPELYREHAKRGVQLMFHSYYNGKRKFKNPKNPDENIWGVITEPTMQTYAAENNMWISANNTTTPESCWPSFFVRPDGVITGRLKRNRESLLISIVDTRYSYYDASREWRERAMSGVYHSGEMITDERSDDRTSL